MRITLSTHRAEDYELFLKIKRLPLFRFEGRDAIFPDEYAPRLGMTPIVDRSMPEYNPLPGLFDYQAAVAGMAIHKRKFAGFIRCGLGKTLVMTEWARYVQNVLGPTRRVLLSSPLMVIRQTIAEYKRFYGGMDGPEIIQIRPKDLNGWLKTAGTEIGITNYESLTDEIQPGRIGALALDEAGMLKSHYGKWGAHCIRLGKGLDWKLTQTGTPAPNDRVEYANQAVFLDVAPTVNAFLAKYFVNRGQTNERWEMKPHAIRPFYRDLSYWSIFLNDPATYGWKDNVGSIPPIEVHIHEIDLTRQQQDLVYEKTGTLFPNQIGGITSRSVLSQIAKGNHKGKSVDTLKPAYIRSLVDSWPTESTIIWCHYNPEQELMAKTFPEAANISGDTPMDRREELIEEFRTGKRKTLISKGKIIGLGLNLQIATRHVFSGLQDSYEEWAQCLARSNRVGSTKTLHAHIPITEVERPMIETVLRKAHRVDQDIIEQEAIFRAVA